jgi:hypothetical protein
VSMESPTYVSTAKTVGRLDAHESAS